MLSRPFGLRALPLAALLAALLAAGGAGCGATDSDHTSVAHLGGQVTDPGGTGVGPSSVRLTLDSAGQHGLDAAFLTTPAGRFDTEVRVFLGPLGPTRVYVHVTPPVDAGLRAGVVATEIEFVTGERPQAHAVDVQLEAAPPD